MPVRLARPRGRVWWIRLLLALTVLNVVALSFVGLFVSRFSDAHWLGTVLSFAPKWPWLLPTVGLLVVWSLSAWFAPRRLLFVGGSGLLLSGALWLFAVAGFVVPFGGGGRGPRVRILTYNLGAKPPIPSASIVRMLDQERVFAATFQECTLPFEDPAWQGWFTQKAFSQCFVARKAPFAVNVRDPKNFWDVGGSGLMSRFDLDTPAGPLGLVNVHLETPRDGFEALYTKRRAGIPDLEAVNRARRTEALTVRDWIGPQTDRVVIAGDFNATARSDILREAFAGFTNAFSAVGFGFGSSKHTRWHAVRIDHVLVGPALAPVDVEVLASLGGDHRPLLVELSAAK
ncbi:MAG: endonuclease/exonuclease/phosphatase family protein [Myxococcales bacterium]|nr:endonuclease/exonuclease/phosphatase family protein [Myxococcales bacterium]